MYSKVPIKRSHVFVTKTRPRRDFYATRRVGAKLIPTSLATDLLHRRLSVQCLCNPLSALKAQRLQYEVKIRFLVQTPLLTVQLSTSTQHVVRQPGRRRPVESEENTGDRYPLLVCCSAFQP